jgi:hypothetical protein
LLDGEGILAELSELGGENVARDTIAGVARLVVGEPELPLLRINVIRGAGEQQRRNREDDAPR